jgi:hypothetical protein
MLIRTTLIRTMLIRTKPFRTKLIRTKKSYYVGQSSLEQSPLYSLEQSPLYSLEQSPLEQKRFTPGKRLFFAGLSSPEAGQEAEVDSARFVDRLGRKHLA